MESKIDQFLKLTPEERIKTMLEWIEFGLNIQGKGLKND